jgi:hypothetical protein
MTLTNGSDHQGSLYALDNVPDDCISRLRFTPNSSNGLSNLSSLLLVSSWDGTVRSYDMKALVDHRHTQPATVCQLGAGALLDVATTRDNQ